jgi:CDGSH-type Zn-finger protein
MAIETTGTTTIRVSRDGPYLVSGPCRLFDARGAEVPARTTSALCRCGNSSR